MMSVRMIRIKYLSLREDESSPEVGESAAVLYLKQIELIVTA